MMELMTDATASPIRQVIRRAVALVVVLAAAAVLAGCGPGTRPTPTPTPVDVAPHSLVMVIRHGEKPDGSNPGVDANGATDDSSLISRGWDRAHRLVDLFDPAQGPPRPGLARPTAIYAAGANNDGEGQRTRETVVPLADHLVSGAQDHMPLAGVYSSVAAARSRRARARRHRPRTAGGYRHH
jgi:hypothetical protein